MFEALFGEDQHTNIKLNSDQLKQFNVLVANHIRHVNMLDEDFKDKGYSRIEVLPGQGLSLSVGQVPPEGEEDLRLNMWGRVTHTPFIGCVPLCQSFGRNFFLEAEPAGKLSAELACPAWTVKVLKDGQDCDGNTHHSG